MRGGGLARGTPPGLLSAALAWLLMLLLSIANGIVRDFAYRDRVGELAAHQISTASGAVLIGLLILAYHRRHPPNSAAQAWRLGLGWMLAVVAFEFGFFHFLAGHAWPELFAAYDLRQGRVWGLFVLWIGLAPGLIDRLVRGRSSP